MIGVRRMLLTLGVLCALFSALVVPVTASAHTNNQTVAQHAAVPSDSPGYRFDAGWYGYGYCFSHSDWQKLVNNTTNGLAEDMLVAALSWNIPSAIAATAIIKGRSSWLSGVDTGNGACVGFVFGNPQWQWYWGRK